MNCLRTPARRLGPEWLIRPFVVGLRLAGISEKPLALERGGVASHAGRVREGLHRLPGRVRIGVPAHRVVGLKAHRAGCLPRRVDRLVAGSEVDERPVRPLVVAPGMALIDAVPFREIWTVDFEFQAGEFGGDDGG